MAVLVDAEVPGHRVEVVEQLVFIPVGVTGEPAQEGFLGHILRLLLVFETVIAVAVDLFILFLNVDGHGFPPFEALTVYNGEMGKMCGWCKNFFSFILSICKA